MNVGGNSAGGLAVVLTPAAAWRLVKLYNLRALLVLDARRNGVPLDPLVIDALAVLDAGADLYRPDMSATSDRTSAEHQLGHTWLNTREVAERIGRDVRTVRRLCESHGVEAPSPLTSRHDGRRLLITEDSVLEYLSDRARGG